MQYNRDNLEFYFNDDTVQLYQVEDSEIWTLEIFTADQTEDEFNNAEFSGSLDMTKYFEYIKQRKEQPNTLEMATMPFPVTLNFPSAYNDTDKQAFFGSTCRNGNK